MSSKIGQSPDESIPLEGALSLAVYHASTGDSDHNVFCVVDASGSECDTYQSSAALARKVARLNAECGEIERSTERAIIAYLRRRAETAKSIPGEGSWMALALHEEANAIERGDHRDVK